MTREPKHLCTEPSGCDTCPTGERIEYRIEYRYTVKIFRNGEHIYDIHDVKAARLAEGIAHAIGAPFNLPAAHRTDAR